MRLSAAIKWISGTRAQSMAELAVFGSLTLVVLSFLVRYGLQYNHKQQMRMEVFRQAELEAYSGSNTHVLNVYKDFPSAEPQDEWGNSARTVEAGTDYVTWSLEPQNNPGMRYDFISGLTGSTTSKTYTTSAEVGPVSPPFINVDYPDGTQRIPANRMQSITNETYPNGALEILLDEVDFEWCKTHYCRTDVITQADIDDDGVTETILTATGGPGAVSVTAMDPNAGQMDTSDPDAGVKWKASTFTREGTRLDVRDTPGSVSGGIQLHDTTTNEFDINLGRGSHDSASITTTEDQWIGLGGSK